MLDERRKYPRVRCTLTSHFAGAENSPVVLSPPVVVEDISQGGVRLHTQQFIPKSGDLSLQIYLSSFTSAQVHLRVAWSHELPHNSGYRVGAEFVDIRERDKKALQDFIYQVLVEENE